MKLARLFLIPVLLLLQSACQFHAGASTQPPASASSKSSQPKTTPTRMQGPEYEAYEQEVRKHWANNNYEWLENEAERLIASKERLPGGYWKLRVLYRSIEDVVDKQSSDASWQEHIARVEKWAGEHPAAAMPRIILAEVWRSYAWKIRGSGLADTVKPQNWTPFKNRHAKTTKLLAEAAALEQKSPEWYLVALLAARVEDNGRAAFDRLFEQAVAVEPHYYYLYQAKAAYLLPQWHGQAGEWERFAEAAANQVGGEQGDIILFTVYAQLMFQRELEFMESRRSIAPRLLAGFKAIDKLYGSSPQRLNEGCLISFFVDDNKTPAELMKRIGNDYDLDVWKDESVFNLFRQEALMRSGELPRYRKTGSSPR
jgi:Domain of unknown function (DUF4034)